MDWPFDQSANTAAITTRFVLENNFPILSVVHYSDDHSWAFTCGATYAEADGRVISMAEALAIDPSLGAVADLPPGWTAWREAVHSPWTRTVNSEESLANSLSPQQVEICLRYQAGILSTLPKAIIGVAAESLALFPLNGLRHPATQGTSGWYIWGGVTENFEALNFAPICLDHVLESSPKIAPYLALAPGWRFLIDPRNGHEDVWYDESLFNV